jgi:hypothetical protein
VILSIPRNLTVPVPELEHKMNQTYAINKWNEMVYDTTIQGAK